MANDSGVVSDNLPLFSDTDEDVISTCNLSHDNHPSKFWFSIILINKTRSFNKIYHHQGSAFLQIWVQSFLFWYWNNIKSWLIYNDKLASKMQTQINLCFWCGSKMLLFALSIPQDVHICHEHLLGCCKTYTYIISSCYKAIFHWESKCLWQVYVYCG